MNILVLSTSTNNTHSFIGSLESLGEHQVQVLRYDQKWQEAASQMVQANPDMLQRLQSGQVGIPRERCMMDKEILLEAQIGEPDAIVYISAWQGPYVPLNETLGELNQIAPVIHFLCDGGDHPWWSQLEEFERRGTFSLTVNIDGCRDWPGDRPADGRPPLKNCMTLLTPVDTRHYAPTGIKFVERPYAIGYAGNNSGHMRSSIVQRLQAVRGFSFKDRDHHPQSYPGFCEFLKHVRISVSVPFTGSGAARHVKGRVLETGFAGACLLEWKNPATRGWFTPREMFWEYESVEECAELAEWLAAHPKLAEETAMALKAQVEKEHAPKVFWDKVLGRVKK